MEILVTFHSQAGLIEHPSASIQLITVFQCTLGFEIPENCFLVIWSIITNLQPYPFPKGQKKWSMWVEHSHIQRFVVGS